MLRATASIHVRRVADLLAAGRWLALAAVGGLTGLVYWLGLVSPYSVGALGLRPHMDIARLTRGHPQAQISLVLTYACLLSLYYLAWRLCRLPAANRPAETQRSDTAQSARLWVVLLLTLAAVNLAMLSLYPIGATDIFDYVAQGREISVWGGNPFYLPAGAFPKEPVLAYTAWSGLTTLYGPAWQWLAALLTRLAGSDLGANLLAFKSLDLLFYAGCIAVIAAFWRGHAPERALSAVCLFALNPLVIYETAGNGHNDIVMVFWMLLGVYCLSRERHSLAALALTAGLLTKFVPVYILPIVLVYSLGRLPNWRARGRFLLVTGLACGLLVAAVAGPFWHGGDIFSAQQRLGMFTTSLPAFAEAVLEPRLGRVMSQRWVAQVSLWLMGAAVAGAAAFVGWTQARHVTRARPGRRRQSAGPRNTLASAAAPPRAPAAPPWLLPLQASTVVLLIYLLLACLWFEGWYALWPLSLAALLPDGALATSAVLLSVAGLWKPIYFDYFLSRPALPPRVRRETLLAPEVLGFSWLFAVVTTVRAGWRVRFSTKRDPSGPGAASRAAGERDTPQPRQWGI